MAPTLAELDAKSRRWAFPTRLLYLAVKWSLVALGAYLLLGLYVTRWGWPAALWFLLFPLAYGLWRGWPTGRPR